MDPGSHAYVLAAKLLDLFSGFYLEELKLISENVFQIFQGSQKVLGATIKYDKDLLYPIGH